MRPSSWMSRNKHMKNPFILCCLSALLCVVARANDTSITAIGGTAVALHHEHLFVEMVRETVRLDLHKDTYEVTVDFVFRNHGAARDVLMGFPESGGGMDKEGPLPKDAMIQDFISTVDGTPVSVKRIKATESNDAYQAYWTKSVAFGKDQQRKIHVHYRSPYGGGIEGTLAAYYFTGGNWRGKVQESVLVITPHAGAPKLPFVRLGKKYLSEQDTGKPRRFVWHNWEAEGQLWLTGRKKK